MEGSEDMCLKIFGEDRNKFFEQNPNLNNIHGQHIEVQTGLFVNQHSNDFVKMYFGKVSPINDSDGFLVTQFLSYDTEPVQTGGTNNNKYKIYSNDAFANHNIINGKIIDFGDVHVS